MTKSLHEHLSKIRPVETVIEAAKYALRKATGKATMAIRKGWSGVLGFRHEDLVFVGVQTLTKPPKRVMAIYDVGSSAYLPSEEMAHLKYVCERMGLHTNSEILNLFELCNLDYGLISKNSSATQIEDLTELGDLPKGIDVAAFDEFWWQKWGGKLYGVLHTPEEVDISLVGTRMGKYQRLPTWIAK